MRTGFLVNWWYIGSDHDLGEEVNMSLTFTQRLFVLKQASSFYENGIFCITIHYYVCFSLLLRLLPIGKLYKNRSISLIILNIIAYFFAPKCVSS